MSNPNDEKKERQPVTNPETSLSSEELGALVVDALLRAHILRKEDVERAIRIAAEEIESRKAIGDY